jgi:hypothetical protein
MPPQQDASICPERKSAPAEYMLDPDDLQEIKGTSADDVDALKVVTENYALFHLIRNQLIDLQNWERSQSE